MTELKPPSTLYLVCGNYLQHLDLVVCFADQVEVETKVVPGTESEGGRMLRWAEEWPRHDTRGEREE